MIITMLKNFLKLPFLVIIIIVFILNLLIFGFFLGTAIIFFLYPLACFYELYQGIDKNRKEELLFIPWFNDLVGSYNERPFVFILGTLIKFYLAFYLFVFFLFLHFSMYYEHTYLFWFSLDDLLLLSVFLLAPIICIIYTIIFLFRLFKS